MATQMQHGVFWREIAWPPGHFREKNNNRVKSDKIKTSLLTWITEKELQRWIKKQRRQISLEEKDENWR